jgi:hypothetical protein
MQQGERDWCWIESFTSKVQDYGRVFPDGIKKDWIFERSRRLSKNLD